MCRYIGSGSRPCRHAFMLPVASAHEASCIMPLRSMWMECLTALHAGGRKKAARRRLVQLLEIFDLLFDGAAVAALISVFTLGVCDGLPLHVFRPIWTTGAKRDDVIHHVTRAGMVRFRRPGCGARGRADKGSPGGVVARGRHSTAEWRQKQEQPSAAKHHSSHFATNEEASETLNCTKVL